MKQSDLNWIQLFYILKATPGLGEKRLQYLNQNYTSLFQAVVLDQLTPDELFMELIDDDQLPKPIKRALMQSYMAGGNRLDMRFWHQKTEELKQILAYADHNQIKIIHMHHKDYPKRLKTIANAPCLLSGKGNIALWNAPLTIAVVGTRTPTELTKRFGMRLSEWLSYTYQAVIVSGLAIGSDTCAHLGALSGSKQTMAVMPHHLFSDYIYPKQNKKLADEIIAEGGLLVSEYIQPKYQKVRKNQLIERDIWQAGLSDGLIALEFHEEGGTRHAVNQALELGRFVAVVDYQNHPRSDIRSLFEHHEQFSGNRKYLKQSKDPRNLVTPIFSKASIEHWVSTLAKERQESSLAQEADMFFNIHQTKLDNMFAALVS